MSHYQTTLPEHLVCESDRSLRHNLSQLQTAPNTPTNIKRTDLIGLQCIESRHGSSLKGHKQRKWMNVVSTDPQKQPNSSVYLFRALVCVSVVFGGYFRVIPVILSSCIIYILIKRGKQGT